MDLIQNYIGGKWQNAQSNQWLDNANPATGEVYSRLPDSDALDVQSAVVAAKESFKEWSLVSTKNRADILRKIAQLIDQQKEKLAQAESIDTGKPIKLSLYVDIPRAAKNFEFFSDAITQFGSECFPMDQLALNYTLHQPLGVVGCIVPWNLPLYLLTWKVAPALAVGNTVVAKPSELTPMTAHLFSKICFEAGLPPGVLNIVYGIGPKVGAEIARNPNVKAVSFTGSTKTGSEIARLASPTFKKLSLEMGGKNPTIIFSDCDFEHALNETLRAAFSNQGQICLCGSRIFIEKPLYERFKNALVDKTKQLVLGDPLSLNTDQGALISKSHFEKVFTAVENAKQQGGRLLCGGKKFVADHYLHGNGYFFEPTLIEGLDPFCSTNQEEIFGPVATLLPFETEEQVLSLSNSTRYGLAATIFTQDLKRAHVLASKLEVGIVWINGWMLRDLRTPFGGMKSSGLGREGGVEALRFFTEQKNICVQLN